MPAELLGDPPSTASSTDLGLIWARPGPVPDGRVAPGRSVRDRGDLAA